MALTKTLTSSKVRSGRDALTEEAKIFAAYGLNVTATLAKTEDEAVAMAEDIGYPIVMKDRIA